MRHRVPVTIASAFIGVAMTLVSTGVGASATSNAPKRGGTLKMEGVGLSWSTMDPPTASPNQAPLLAPIYEGLFTTNTKGDVEPQLATSYSYNKARTVLTINLRKGVKFQDGTTFNAQAAQFNLEREIDPKSTSACISYGVDISSVTVAGPYTLRLNFTTPYGPMLSELAGQTCFLMASPSAIAQYGSSYAVHPVGTGPYRFVGEVVNSSIAYSRWSGYWQKGKQYFNNLTFNVSNNDQSALDAIETGQYQVDLGLDVTAQDAQQAATIKSLKVEDGPYETVVGIRLNLTKPPFNNKTARLALVQAIDSKAIAKALYSNMVQATQSYETADNYYFDGTTVPGYPKYSPTAAANDSKAVGGLSFTMNIPSAPANVQLGEVIQSQLQAAGITVKLNPLDEVTVLADFHSLAYQAGMSAGGTSNFPDPDTLYYRNFESTSASNQSGLNDPMVDNLVTQARGTVLPANRKHLYEQAQKQLTGSNADFPLVPLFATRSYTIISKQLHGFPVYASNRIDVTDSWLG